MNPVLENFSRNIRTSLVPVQNRQKYSLAQFTIFDRILEDKRFWTDLQQLLPELLKPVVLTTINH